MGCSASIHKDSGVEEVPPPVGRAGTGESPSFQASSREHTPCPSVPPAVKDPAEAGTQAFHRRESSQNKSGAPQLPDTAHAAAPAADVEVAPGQLLEDVAGDAHAAHACIEERIGAVAQTREMWMSSIEFNSEDLATKDVDVVLDGAEQLVHLFRSACGKGQQERAALPDIQSLQLPKRTRPEQFFAKYSALGQVLVDMAGPAMEAMPFGAPAAAVIGAVYARAAQAARLSRNCEMLLGLLKSVDAQLARVLDSLASRRMKAPSSVESALQELLLQIVQGGRLMQDYAERGFLMRFILNKGDERRFAELDQGIHQSMEWTAFCVSMDLLASPACYQPDESASMRAAVCAAANMPEGRAEEALRQLAQSDPGRLKELIQQHASFSVQVLSAEVDSIAKRVGVLESKVARLERQNAQAASRQEQDTQLEAYLDDWWKQCVGVRKRSVSVDEFFKKLIAWFKGKGLLSVLLEYEEEVEEHCSDEMLEAAAKKVYLEEGGRVLIFLTFVLLPLVDADKDDKVAYTELLGLQVMARECAEHLKTTLPTEMVQLLDVICRGFDENAVFKKAHYTASTPGIAFVSQALKVTPILQSYNANLLLESHVHGTRQWLFDRVNKWLEDALGAGRDAGTLNHHRMLLLLVHHFFKVGEPRAQGKAMVLCLAMQLAEQLPGMATLLQAVAKEHGCADQLSLRDTFDKYLLEPLTALDKEHSVDQPVVIMLLDAIDEAADGAMGCESVANLVGNQMSKLPAWVKIILTGRPQMESCFQAWQPEWIEPSARENMEDMSMLLVARLQRRGNVSPVDLAAAVEVMLRKSQGQFIWAKYAFDQLSSREGFWTPAEMEAALPLGLFGMFRHIMEVLQDALREENPDALALLRQQLLPILVAAKSPLSPQQLTFMAGAEQHQVDLLLRLLVNMFPVRLQSGSLRVVPYHKSVLDWLVEDPQFAVDIGHGHECAGKACFAAVMAARVSPSKLANGGDSKRKSSSHPSASILEYALRFGVTHLCLANGCMEILEGLILDFCGLWPMAFAEGCGTELLKDLIALGPKTSAAAKDVVRWLRLTSSYLSMYPRAAFQLACDSPHNSVVARHANSLPHQPQAKLLTKEQDWHACLSTLTGHTGIVTSVAVGTGTIVSGSEDKTVRVWDLDSGTSKATLAGHRRVVTSVAISADARTCVSGSEDRTLSQGLGPGQRDVQGNAGRTNL